MSNRMILPALRRRTLVLVYTQHAVDKYNNKPECENLAEKHTANKMAEATARWRSA